MIRVLAKRAAHLRVLAVLAMAALSQMPQQASAQTTVALVNSQPITNFDVQQRIRVAALTERRRLDARGALNELIDDQVKLLESRRLGFRVTEPGVDAEFTKLARGNGQTDTQFGETLRRAGLEPSAIRDSIRANIAWQVLLRDHARRGAEVSNAEIDAAIEKERKARAEIVDYQLQTVIFVVPRGTNPGERERAANAARGKFSGCETGIDELRQLRDVAVRPVMSRSTEGMNAQLAAILAKTPVGKMTPPIRSEQGVELVAVCERATRTATGDLRSEVAAKLAEQKAVANARGYLETLRKKVDIRMMR